MRNVLQDVIYDDSLEELRFRLHKPVQAVYADRDRLFPDVIMAEQECEYMLGNFCRQSVYSCEDDMREGFITLPFCGMRIGISGNVLSERGRIVRFRTVTGFCVRFPHEHKGCAKALCEAVGGLYDGSLLVASLPGQGKTTLLRDLSRELSDTYKRKVCIIDERSEIAGTGTDGAAFDVGERTDVIDGCPKSEGMILAMRTLSPHVIVTDEIGTEKADFDSIRRVLLSGVSLAVSIHADSEECAERICAEINPLIRYFAFIRNTDGKRTVEVKDRVSGDCKILDVRFMHQLITNNQLLITNN